MREIIRFAWGSVPRDFMVAMSDKGIVALEFNSATLRRRTHCASASRRLTY